MKNNERKPSFIAAIVFPCRVKQSSSQLYRVFAHFEYFVVSSALFKDQKLRVPPLSLRLCVFPSSTLHRPSSLFAVRGRRRGGGGRKGRPASTQPSLKNGQKLHLSPLFCAGIGCASVTFLCQSGVARQPAGHFICNPFQYNALQKLFQATKQAKHVLELVVLFLASAKVVSTEPQLVR